MPDGHWILHSGKTKNATCIKGRLYSVEEIDETGLVAAFVMLCLFSFTASLALQTPLRTFL